MSAAQLMRYAQHEPRSMNIGLVEMMQQPNLYTSAQILEAGLYPPQLLFLDRFREALASGRIRRAGPGQATIPFELLANGFLRHEWIGDVNDPTSGFAVPSQSRFTPYAFSGFDVQPGASPLEDLRWHNHEVAQAAEGIFEWIKDIDRDISSVLIEHNFRPSLQRSPLSPAKSAGKHDIGKFSRAFPVLAGRKEPSSLAELEALKRAHVLIGTSLLDVSVRSKQNVTTMELEHFVVQLMHHWFFKNYPDLDALPILRSTRGVVPFIKDAARILVSGAPDTKLSDMLDEVLGKRNIFLSYVFLSVIKAVNTSIADEFVARAECHRPYMIQRGQVITPEQARDDVAELIYQRNLPWPFLDAFLAYTQGLVTTAEPELYLEVGA